MTIGAEHQRALDRLGLVTESQNPASEYSFSPVPDALENNTCCKINNFLLLQKSAHKIRPHNYKVCGFCFCAQNPAAILHFYAVTAIIF